MELMNRRGFLSKSAVTSAGLIAGRSDGKKAFAKNSPNETINIAVAGIGGRGKSHITAFAKLPNAKVATLCDVDERLFESRIKMVEEAGGNRPKTETDFPKVLDDKNIDAVSIATLDHWHALQTIWACHRLERMSM